jgi:peptide/nickel transport system permease protein
MKIAKKLLFQLLLTFLSIILISGLPELIMNKDVSAYFGKIKAVSIEMLRLNKMIYFNQGTQRLFLEDIWGPYFYSLTIPFGALFIAFCFAQVLTWGTLMLPNLLRNII